MEKKNMVLLTVIAVATLLVAVVGATFAYFTASTNIDAQADSETGQTNITTANVTNTSVVANITGSAGKFDAKNVYPGHMEIAALSVKVSTEEEVQDKAKDVYVPFIYDVSENTISQSGKGKVVAYLYRSETAIQDITSEDLGCQIVTDAASEPTKVHYSETCTFTNASEVNSNPSGVSELNSLTLIAKEELAGGKQTIQMAVENIQIPINSKDKTYYYYFVLHFENQESDQNEQSGKELKGTLRVA